MQCEKKGFPRDNIFSSVNVFLRLHNEFDTCECILGKHARNFGACSAGYIDSTAELFIHKNILRNALDALELEINTTNDA